jgi:hypothetical protein
MHVLRAIRSWWSGDRMPPAGAGRGVTPPRAGAAPAAPECEVGAAVVPAAPAAPERDDDAPTGREAGAASLAAPRTSGDPAIVAERQERAAERLLMDEALRGDLADDEFQPLLDWALAQATTRRHPAGWMPAWRRSARPC